MEFLKKKIKNILNTLGYELINKNQKTIAGETLIAKKN